MTKLTGAFGFIESAQDWRQSTGEDVELPC
jgi:hypothetical protein